MDFGGDTVAPVTQIYTDTHVYAQTHELKYLNICSWCRPTQLLFYLVTSGMKLSFLKTEAEMEISSELLSGRIPVIYSQ